jgi:glucoamylase
VTNQWTVALAFPSRGARSDQKCVGTAYSALSEVWFTASRGIVNEIYHPTVDRPQVRDLILLVGDRSTFLVGEREMHTTYHHLGGCMLGIVITPFDGQRELGGGNFAVAAQ